MNYLIVERDTAFVGFYANIPLMFFKENGLTYPRENSTDLQQLLEFTIESYRETALWLFSLICNQSYDLKKNPEYRAQADLARLYYELCKEVWFLDKDIQSDYSSPEFWWFQIEYEGYKRLLENTGVFGQPKVVSKHNRYVEICEAYKLISELQNLKLNPNSERYTETHCEVLIHHAVLLAAKNQLFRCKFQSFGREIKRHQRRIRDEPDSYYYLNSQGHAVTGKALVNSKSFRP